MRFVFMVFCLFTFSWVNSQEVGSLTKKEAKFVKTVFPGDLHVEVLSLTLSDSSLSNYLQEGDRFSLVRQQDQLIGYLLSTQALGRFDYFDYLLAFDSDLSVLGVTVTVYRSPQGAAICQKKWLSQFKGYEGDDLSLGRDINAISGATISATSMVQDVQRCYRLMSRLKEAGHLP